MNVLADGGEIDLCDSNEYSDIVDWLGEQRMEEVNDNIEGILKK